MVENIACVRTRIEHGCQVDRRAILQKEELLLGAPLDKLEGDVATDTVLDLLQEVRLG